MNNSEYCFFNGEYIRYNEICIHVSDLQFQRGYGVFDFFRTRNGEIPWMDDYLDRFFNSSIYAGINCDLNRQEVRTVIHSLLEKNGLENGAFKLILTGGYSDNLENVTGHSNLLILNRPWKRPPADTFERGVNLISDYFVRPNPEIKSLYYLNSLRLQQKMKAYNAVDVLYHTDIISETSRANLFFVKNGRIFTPASNILNGITRKQLLKTIPEIQVEDIEASRLYDFDEVFLSSTSREITPVIAIDGNKTGNGTPGKITREIMEMLHRTN